MFSHLIMIFMINVAYVPWYQFYTICCFGEWFIIRAETTNCTLMVNNVMSATGERLSTGGLGGSLQFKSHLNIMRLRFRCAQAVKLRPECGAEEWLAENLCNSGVGETQMWWETNSEYHGSNWELNLCQL